MEKKNTKSPSKDDKYKTKKGNNTNLDENYSNIQEDNHNSKGSLMMEALERKLRLDMNQNGPKTTNRNHVRNSVVIEDVTEDCEDIFCFNSEIDPIIDEEEIRFEPVRGERGELDIEELEDWEEEELVEVRDSKTQTDNFRVEEKVKNIIIQEAELFAEEKVAEAEQKLQKEDIAEKYHNFVAIKNDPEDVLCLDLSRGSIVEEKETFDEVMKKAEENKNYTKHRCCLKQVYSKVL